MLIDVDKSPAGDALRVSVQGATIGADYARLVLNELLAAQEKRSMDGAQWWDVPTHEFLELKRKLDAAGHTGDGRTMTEEAVTLLGTYTEDEEDAKALKRGEHNEDIDWGQFHTTPYPDQKTGIRFLTAQWRALLADEMGIGKSLESLYCDQIWRRYGYVDHTLILCPNSVKSGWGSQIRIHVPGASHLVVGNGTSTVMGDLGVYAANPTDYLVVHYDCLVERKSKALYMMPRPDLEQLLDRCHLIRAIAGSSKVTPTHRNLMERVQMAYQHPLRPLRQISEMPTVKGVSAAVYKRVLDYARSSAFPGHLIKTKPTQRTVLDTLLKLRICNVIVDEFHLLKDPRAGRTEAVLELLQKLKPTPKELAEVTLELETGARVTRIVNQTVQPVTLEQEVDLRTFL